MSDTPQGSARTPQGEGGTVDYASLDTLELVRKYRDASHYFIERWGREDHMRWQIERDALWAELESRLGSASSSRGGEPGDRERRHIRATMDAVLHQLEHGPASHGDRRDLKWCATQLRAALSRPEGDHA